MQKRRNIKEGSKKDSGRNRRVARRKKHHASVKGEVWQTHHVVYADPGKGIEEVTVRLRRKEHYYVTMLQRFKAFSPGFIVAVEYELLTKKIIKEGAPSCQD